MKKFKKTAIPVVLASAMIVAALPGTAFAAESADSNSESQTSSDSSQAAIDDAIEAYASGVDPYASKSDDALDTYSDYPEAYDLTDGHIMNSLDRDVTGLTEDVEGQNVITPVKLQNPYGTCWGFAATAAAEGSIVSELKSNDENVNPRDDAYNFSEKYLAWFTANYLDAEASGHTEYASQDGEGRHWADSVSDSSKYTGGQISQATALYASGLGPVYEYDKDEDGKWVDGLYTYKGLKGAIEYNVDDSGEWYAFCYTDNEGKLLEDGTYENSWAIAQSERFHQEYQLEESYLLPTPAEKVTNKKTKETEYKFNEEGINAVKDQLVNNNRPVSVAFCADTSKPNEAGEAKYINTKNWAHYTYTQEDANHAVLIVGYDDNYSASNFNSENQPEGDGAFLVKNSWGSGEEEFPNKANGSWGIEIENEETGETTHTGYFWISYYDESICCLEALNFDTDTEWDEYILNQYDFMPAQGVLCYPIKDENDKLQTAKLANVFTANEGGEKIFAVSCQTGSPNTTVDYQIVLLADDSENPEDGYVIYEGSETYKYGGYHRHNIPSGEEVSIPQGGKYAVICTLKEQVTDEKTGKTETGCDIYMNYSLGKSSDDATTWFEGVINPGESYLYNDSEGWQDFSAFADKLQTAFDQLLGIKMEFDNFNIKTYANAIEDNDFTVSLSSTSINHRLHATDDETEIIAAYITGTADPKVIGSIEWSSSDEDIVEITEDSGQKCTIEAKGYGTAYISCYVPSIGFKLCKVEVVKIPINEQLVLLPDYSFKYTGKALKPEVYMCDDLMDKIDPSNYTVSYSNNKNVGTAIITIKATANSIYGGTAIEKFKIIKADNPMKLKVASKTLKYKTLKKKKLTFTIKYKTKAQGKVTYTLSKAAKKAGIKVNSKGKVTVPKGCKKGTYKITVKAKGNGNYNASAAKTFTIKVK